MGQISFILLGTVLLYQFAAVAILQALEVEGRRHYVSEADFVTGILVSLNGAPVPKRENQAKEIMLSAPYVQIALQEQAPQAARSNDPVVDAEISRINEHLRGSLTVFPAVAPDRSDESFAAMFPDGGYCLVSIDQERKPAKLLWRWITDPEPAVPLLLTRWPRALLLYLISVCVLLIWVANSIVSPIVKLSREVKAVALDGDYSMNISERGAEEIRELTRSVNEMHRKIFDMACHRRYALAALSHDLKTILTRLKLRVEFVSDESIYHKFKADFDLMDSMIQRKLEFLRAEGNKSDYIRFDLSGLIGAVIDQFGSERKKIQFAGANGICIEGSVSDMFRVLTNLLSNAVKYSDNINIAVSSVGDRVLVEIADDGPGIPIDMKKAVFEPFVRGNPEQTLDKNSGFGLGLSIVKTLLDRQGAEITLADNVPKGLIVRLMLPKVARRV
jgi:signal transduction histidine kinase